MYALGIAAHICIGIELYSYSRNIYLFIYLFIYSWQMQIPIKMLIMKNRYYIANYTTYQNWLSD